MSCNPSLSLSLADLAETRLHHPQEPGVDNCAGRSAHRRPNSARAMPSRAFKRGLPSFTTILKDGVLIDIHLEVAEGLSARKPVVALESTIIPHGIPYPANLETARSGKWAPECPEVYPPPSVSSMDVSKWDLSHGLERLTERWNEPLKLSRRDIVAAIALKRDVGTTCSATLIFGALAGI